MRKAAKIFVGILLIALVFGITGCGKKSALTQNRWYNEDVNKTLRTIIEFTEDGKYITKYLVLDERKREKMGLPDVSNIVVTSYYKDHGEKKDKETKAFAEDSCHMVIYDTEKDFNEDKNGSKVFYRIEDLALIIGGEEFKMVDEKLGEETDKLLQKVAEKAEKENNYEVEPAE